MSTCHHRGESGYPPSPTLVPQGPLSSTEVHWLRLAHALIEWLVQPAEQSASWLATHPDLWNVITLGMLWHLSEVETCSICQLHLLRCRALLVATVHPSLRS